MTAGPLEVARRPNAKTAKTTGLLGVAWRVPKVPKMSDIRISEKRTLTALPDRLRGESSESSENVKYAAGGISEKCALKVLPVYLIIINKK